MGRSILAVFLGLLGAMVVIFALEMIGHLVYPPSPGLDLSDPAPLRSLAESMTVGAFLLLLAGWLVGASVGGWLAARIARRAPIVHGLIVGGIITLGAVANWVMIPHPLWVMGSGLLGVLPAAYVGSQLATRKREPQHPAPAMAGSS